MKYILILSILAALLVDCAVAPVGYGDGNYRSRDFNDGNYRHYSYRSDHANQGDPQYAEASDAALKCSIPT